MPLVSGDPMTSSARFRGRLDRALLGHVPGHARGPGRRAMEKQQPFRRLQRLRAGPLGALGWMEGYSLVTEDRIAPEWFMWNGASVEAYDNDWEPDKTPSDCGACRRRLMNLVFMKEAALSAQPNFWFEPIFWDGNQPGQSSDKYAQYQSQGVEYTPALYSGWAQYSMWLLVPRVAREWRASDRRPPALVAILRTDHRRGGTGAHGSGPAKFWRKGELVPNTSRSHPFNGLSRRSGAAVRALVSPAH